MIFSGRYIQDYELELNGTDVGVTQVEIDVHDVIAELFEDFDGIEYEMVEWYKGSWGEFSGDQLKEIHSSLTEYLKCEWEFEPEEKPGVKKGYEVGMVLRMTKDNAYHITGKKGSLFEVVEVLGKARDEVILKLLDSEGDETYNSSWILPDFRQKEEFGLELVEGAVAINTVENASTQELLAEIQKRLGE